MLGFSPFKKRANKFNYTPRYYDPEAEHRAQRRAELRGERPGDADLPYEPGQYIRTARTARAARREAEREAVTKRRYGGLLVVVVVLAVIAFVIYPRVMAMLNRRANAPVRSERVAQPAAHTSEFDQSGISDVEWQEMPITVVPNDYQGE